MPDDFQTVCIKLPLPGARWLAMLLPAVATVAWLAKGYAALAAGAAMLVPGLLAVGNKFELEVARRRYREGYHWAHWLNPPWQRLPPVQGVLVKPHTYRTVTDSKYGWRPSGEVSEVFIVLLSVPGTARGMVVGIVTDEAEAETMAAAIAGALQVPWRRA